MSDAEMEGSGQPPLTSSQPPSPPLASPGAQLASRRQELGWSIEQVANQLNLAPRQVQAMEDDNYAALPGMVIARGFVRAYAKLLKFDPAPLLALITDKAAPSPESLELRRTLSATFTESNLPTAKRSGSGGKWLALILLLLALAAAGWLAWREGWLAGLQLPDGSPMPAQQTQEAPEAGSGVPLGLAEEGAPPSTPGVDASSPAQSPVQTPTPAPANPAAVPAPSSSAAPAQAAAVAAAVAAPAQAPAGSQPVTRAGDKLVLKMREASWIELRREDGEAVASRLVPAGATESFDIGPGARLVVGNATGVDATFRGQALDLNAGAKSNVARLTLK
ncbi:MAG TPA: DUF4115 domain-containing protein [Oxalobacteraceae bacterium]|nr:DUF4115 domain-containing protein [Oxalobacteraceae bacterium]